MTDRLKTVYPPKTSFCGGYNNLTHISLASFLWIIGNSESIAPDVTPLNAASGVHLRLLCWLREFSSKTGIKFQNHT